MRENESASWNGQPALPLASRDCLADKLGLWLRVAQRTFAELVNSDFRRYRMTQLDFLVISLIAENPGCRQAIISQVLEIKSPNLAASIEYLTQRGFLLKTQDSFDRRANRLTLTDSGYSTQAGLARRYAEVMGSFFPGPDGHRKREILIDLLKSIAAHPYWAAHISVGVVDPVAFGPVDADASEGDNLD